MSDSDPGPRPEPEIEPGEPNPGGPDAVPEPARAAGSPASVAWRMRLLERQMQLTELTRRGVPVVPWRGPGTLDEVLRRLARRSRLPREVTR